MDERTALRMLAADLPGAGDDAAVVDGLVMTTDMLHETTDFPTGTTSYTAGWRSVGASLSDVAAMGADATAAVAAYAAPTFEPEALSAFVRGAREVCTAVDAEYVGGDLDRHTEFTVATTAVGTVEEPVRRAGAEPGDVVCVTGTLGRSAAGLRAFEDGRVDEGNALFRFTPRVDAGRTLNGVATAMMDSSDGLARSLYQLGEASNCGFEIEEARLPVDPAVDAIATSPRERRDLAVHFGEDFELVCTLPPGEAERLSAALETPLTRIGAVVESGAGVTLDGHTLPDRGYTHGEGENGGEGDDGEGGNREEG